MAGLTRNSRQALLLSGTAALPGLAFANDTNTGIFRPGANELALVTNGVSRLTIDASGNVAVASALTVNGGTAATLDGTQTLTNKTISGSSNTLSNIGNSSLTNSTVTIGSTSVSLGGTASTIAGLTLTSPSLSGSISGTYTLGGTPTISGVAVTNGTLALAALNTTGTASASTYLRGDGAWTAIAGTSFATATDYRANAAGDIALSPSVVWSAAAPVTLTYSATVTPDLSTGVNFSLALTGNVTLANPTNMKAGQSGYIYISQDATGSRTISYGAYWKFPTGTSKTLSTAANSADVLYYTVHSSTVVLCSLQKAYG